MFMNDLDDAELWMDRNGIVHRIADMDLDHVRHTIAHVRNNARRYHGAAITAGWRALASVQGDMASLMIEGDLAQLEDTDPLDYVNATRTMRALVARLPENQPPPSRLPANWEELSSFELWELIMQLRELRRAIKREMRTVLAEFNRRSE